jgi:hypothetical protein
MTEELSTFLNYSIYSTVKTIREEAKKSSDDFDQQVLNFQSGVHAVVRSMFDLTDVMIANWKREQREAA